LSPARILDGRARLYSSELSYSAVVINISSVHFVMSNQILVKRLSKIPVTFKTHNGDNFECFKKLVLSKVIVPCDIYRSNLS